jgi:hypothetical protein
MPDRKHSASAHVTLTLEVDVGSAWGGNSTVAQVHQQAGDDAVGAVLHMINAANRRSWMRVVGQPRVTTVTSTVESK